MMQPKSLVGTAAAALLLLAASPMPATALPELPIGGGVFDAIGDPAPVDLILSGGDEAPGTCQGDPCAITKCTAGDASAHAVGSEWSGAFAHVTTANDYQTGSGTSHAEAAGPAPSEASARGEKNWSPKSRSAGCRHSGSDLLDLGGGGQAFSEGLALTCVADDAIAGSGAFSGRVYLGPAGEVLLVGEDGRGLRFATPDVVVGGASLAAIGPVATDGFVATALAVGFDITDGGPDGADACSATFA